MQEWEKLSGVNRQRQGSIGNYEGKATSQQAIVQSSHITEDIFRKFNRLEQRDLQAMLDYSKEAWLTSTIAEMFDAENFSQIKLKIKSAEKAMEELQQQQQEAQQQQQQAALEQQAKEAQDLNMNKEKDREVQIKVAMIHARDNDSNAKLNLDKGMRELDLKEQELNLKERDLDEKGRSNKSGEAIKRRDSENKVKIAKSKSKPSNK